jgi:hypothetical protein
MTLSALRSDYHTVSVMCSIDVFNWNDVSFSFNRGSAIFELFIGHVSCGRSRVPWISLPFEFSYAFRSSSSFLVYIDDVNSWESARSPVRAVRRRNFSFVRGGRLSVIIF